MALYVYERWNVERTYETEYRYKEGSWDFIDETSFGIDFTIMSGNRYSLNVFTGYFSTSGGTSTIVYPAISSRHTEYEAQGSGVTKRTYIGNMGNSGRVTVVREYMSSERYLYDSYWREYRGSNFLGTVIAESGAYPTNGSKGGYWYVRKSLATPPELLQPNGGESIDNKYSILWKNSLPDQQTRVELSTDNGVSWQVIGTVAKGVSQLEYDFLNATASSKAKIRVAHFDGKYTGAYDTSDGVFAIIHNKPPNAPSNLTPSNTPIAYATMNFLRWKFNDPNVNDTQSRYDLRWRLQGTTKWNTKTENTSKTESAFPPNTFPKGRIEWQVQTRDQMGEISPWSSLVTFNALDSVDVPIITSPEGVTPLSNPVVAWTSNVQTSYHFQLLDRQGELLYDTKEVVSKAKAFTLPYVLENGATYVFKLRIKSPEGLWSEWNEKDVKVSYTSPKQPDLSYGSGYTGNYIHVNNPDPSTTHPKVVRIDYLKFIDNEWVIVKEDGGEVFEDPTSSPNKTEIYRVRLFGDNGTVTETDVFSTTFILEYPTLYNTRTGDILNVRDVIDTNLSRKPEKQFHIFQGKTKAVAESGMYVDRTLNLSWIATELSTYEFYLESLNPFDTYLYRDAEGRKLYVTLTDFVEQEHYNFLRWTLSATFKEVDYFEGGKVYV